ncbi:MAG: RDD family protein [Bryobacterales bacterium]|nr:RDD family protein [Bryobacterales bacterium]
MPVETVATVPVGLTTEGLLGRRYLARLIDSVAITLILAALLLAYEVVATGQRHSAGIPALLLSILGVLFVWIGYGTALESSRWQATIGKKVLRLRVCSGDGGRLTPFQAMKRNLIKDGPFLIFPIIPGGQLLSLLWLGAHVFVVHRSAVSQAIHDHFANSWVAAPEDTIQLRLT